MPTRDCSRSAATRSIARYRRSSMPSRSIAIFNAKPTHRPYKGLTMVSARLKELLLQALEHELGGVLVYQTALECVINDDLREEWEKYLDQTANHVEILTSV